MDISPHGVNLAALGGSAKAPRLLACSSAAFPEGTLRIVHREPNVLDPAVFVGTIREAYNRLLMKTRQVSVSLPDASGHVMLLDLETRFRSHEEGRDIIRWKLKKSVPYDVSDIHLDYQILREKENGELSVLVAIISLQVVTQYEDLILEAGMQPNRIDFTTFNLCRPFARRLEMSEASLLVAYHEGVLSILVFSEGVLEFFRTKELGGAELDMNRVFMEVNSSLLLYRDKNPGHEVKEAFFLGGGETPLFRAVISEACGIEPQTPEIGRIIAISDAIPGGSESVAPLAAALGAAMRNL
ncbi:pilus assembly protein PilM [Geobacter sp.]|uniref:type IV pilus biogenesis protein PilM n=1 Tax=Geobacter sp. TaxID=46610 RepID=UPI0026052970|nr:pilus assembly protein PilM [Geobacter sp.]